MATSIETLLSEISDLDYRLVSLCDMSVHGLPRWWATLHRPSLNREGIDCKFGESTCAYEALFQALCAIPTYLSLKTDQAQPSTDIMAIVFGDDEAPSPKPATFKRRQIV
jgi:hypothetical protein